MSKSNKPSNGSGHNGNGNGNGKSNGLLHLDKKLDELGILIRLSIREKNRRRRLVKTSV